MVELISADIRQIAPKTEELILLLDEERQAKVRAFGKSRSALHSLAAGLLLYCAFGEGAKHARYEHNKRGKPHLSGNMPFNISHAGDYAVLALSQHAVGVDLEQIRPIDWRKIAARFFHPLELTYLEQAENPEAEFFRIWTLKESYLKAEGTGFSISPASFAVLPEGERSARFFMETAYRFTRIDAFPGYCLSVCSLEGDVPEHVSMREF